MDERDKMYFYSPEEFRNILKCSRGLCYEALRQQKIKSFRLGNRYFIPASEIERLSQSVTAEKDSPTKIESDLW